MNLKHAGYEVVEAVDGMDALSKLPTVKPNLIVCDVNMPNMDGLTFVSKVRADENNRFIPIIMLTTESQEEKKKREWKQVLRHGLLNLLLQNNY